MIIGAVIEIEETEDTAATDETMAEEVTTMIDEENRELTFRHIIGRCTPSEISNSSRMDDLIEMT